MNRWTLVERTRLGTAEKIRLARLLYRIVRASRAVAGARSGIVVCRRRGLRWRLDLSEGIDLSIYVFGRFEGSVGRLIDRHLTAGMIALDIGANVGAHAVPMAARVAPSGRVFAVEPTHWAYRRLLVNQRLNRHLEPVLTPVRAALGVDPASGASEYYASWNLKQQRDVHDVHRGALRSAREARRLTLDGLVAELGLKKLDFIKIDVDGCECEVLSGGRETLARLRPLILFEFCPYALEEHGCDARRLLGILEEHGYSFEDGRGKPIPPGELVPRTPRGGSINVLAIP
jgi:FkbM family methyltransferase